MKFGTFIVFHLALSRWNDKKNVSSFFEIKGKKILFCGLSEVYKFLLQCLANITNAITNIS